MNGIHPKLKTLATPVGDLTFLPGNPRQGTVPAVVRSYERFGQRKPIIATKDGTVIAGNHQLLAARELGWDKIAVIFTDDDDATARAFALADNHTSDLGTYDDDLLAEMLSYVSDTPDLLAATSYTDKDLKKLLGELDVGDTSAQLGELEYRVQIICDNEVQQAELLARFEEEGFKVQGVIV